MSYVYDEYSLEAEESGHYVAFFVQDDWAPLDNLTVNLGFRWDFTAPSYDKGGAYHSADLSSLYGPSGIGNLFKPEDPRTFAVTVDLAAAVSHADILVDSDADLGADLDSATQPDCYSGL